jgi:alkylglycerol monooxygenase
LRWRAAFRAIMRRVSRLENNAYYALGAPAYVVLVLLELWAARRRGEVAYGFGDTIGNLSCGLGEVVIGIFLGPFLIAMYDFGYAHLAVVHWADGSVVPWVLAFLLADLCYYWYHRAGHAIAALWSIHGVHHQSERFNLTIAMRHPWLSDTYAGVFYTPLPVMGVPATHFFIAISIISFYSLSIHTRMLDRPGLFVFTTPATHILHHARNPRYLGKNLGAMFTLWDRMFGTYVEVDPADPPVLGSRAGYTTHDGARAQWVFPGMMLDAFRQARGLGDRARALFARPGWAPPGATVVPRQPARGDDEISAPAKVYVGAQFVATVVFALYVMWLREQHPFSMLLASSAVILWALSTLGALLDGRAGASGRELLRLAATSLLGAAIAAAPGHAIAGGVLLVSSVSSAGWLLLTRQRVERWVTRPEARGAEAG